MRSANIRGMCVAIYARVSSERQSQEGTIGSQVQALRERVREEGLEQIGQRYSQYRLQAREAEQAMVGSLRRYGQIAPIVVCLREETPELIDGFKRLAAARSIQNVDTLSARLLDVDDRGAKAAIYGLNRAGRGPQELEEAWIVYALVREDGLAQVEVAELLGRHKSWVCRRLALLEKLGDQAMEDLRLGLVSPTVARQLTRLPTGNQAAWLTTARRESLNSTELRGVADLLLSSATREQEEFVPAKPREALREAQGVVAPAWDPRLSSAGNRISKQLSYLLDQLSRVENWLHHRGRAELSACDRAPLAPSFTRLARDARSVAELVDDFLVQLTGL